MNIILAGCSETTNIVLEGFLADTGHRVEVWPESFEGMLRIPKGLFCPDVVISRDGNLVFPTFYKTYKLLQEVNPNLFILCISYGQIHPYRFLKILEKSLFGILHFPVSLAELDLLLARAGEVKRLTHFCRQEAS